MSTCNICCEKYNKSLNAKVVCEIPSCKYEVCKTCVRTYLLGTTNDPHCMNCKNPWSIKFLVDNLNRSYIDNDFKKHRKNLLVENEISRTPELMNLVERTKLLEEEVLQLQELEKKTSEARKIYNELASQVSEKKLHIYRIKNGEDTNKDDRKKFIMPCPADNCKGYLSTHYKCEVCKLHTCPDCFEVIGYSKDDLHECKDENLKSAELIKKETKGCPKCGVRIFKISGCDQMWCTECKVAFSWNTGKIVLSGTIHNPHYYNYLQQNGNGNGNVPRNPGDIVCGGIIPYHNLNYMLRYISQFSQPSWFQYFINTSSLIKQYFEENKILNINHFVVQITELHRHINHISNVDLINSRNKVRTLENHDNNTVQYILNKKTKKELADIIFKNDIQRKKFNELLNVYELLSVVGIERFANINDYYINNLGSKDNSKDKQNSINKLVKLITMFIEFANEYNNLIQYVNKQLYNISYTYNLTVGIYKLTTSGSWDTVSIKCKQSDILKIK